MTTHLTRTGRKWVLVLPFTDVVSTNQIQAKHWAVVRNLTRPWKMCMPVLARSAGVPKGLQKITVVMHYAPGKGRRVPDLDNFHACLKPVVDGLVLAGVIRDDGPSWYVPSAPEVHPRTGTPFGKVWVEVVELVP